MNSTRYVRGYVLMHPTDLVPPHGLDLTPGSRDSIKVEMLTEAFIKNGFDPNEPAMVGYPLDGKIQLVTGTHRHEAGTRADIFLPITIKLRSEVEAIWGTPAWDEFIADIKVKDLELIPVKEGGIPPALSDRVDLSKDYDA